MSSEVTEIAEKGLMNASGTIRPSRYHGLIYRGKGRFPVHSDSGRSVR